MKKKKVILDIKNYDNELEWRKLNCFYRAFMAVFASSGYLDEYFFAVTILGYVVYIVNGERTLTFDGGDNTLRYYNEELKDITGIELLNVDVKNSRGFRKKLRGELDNGRAVIVPGDLYELYYCKTYREQHKRHYIIVKGYDAEKDIFYILDNMHLKFGADTSYYDFMIKSEDLYNLLMSYNEGFNITSSKPFFFGVLRIIVLLIEKMG